MFHRIDLYTLQKNLAITACFFLSVLYSTSAFTMLRGYDKNISDSTPAVLIIIDSANAVDAAPKEHSSCNFTPTNTVFSVNFTSGLAYINTSLYGLEWENGNGPDIYLYKLAASGCAIGTRVGAQPVGISDLEALAYNSDNGFLYSASFSFAVHSGNIVRIDPATGIGTVVGGTLATDVRIVGMTYDPVSKTLYAITPGQTSRFSELWTLNPDTGEAALVGPTNLAVGAVSSLALDRSTTPARLIAGGDKLYSINIQTGAGTAIGGNFNGTLWALANSSVSDFSFGSSNVHIPHLSVDGASYDVVLGLKNTGTLDFELTSVNSTTSASTGDIFTFSNNLLVLPKLETVSPEGLGFCYSVTLVRDPASVTGFTFSVSDLKECL